MILESLFKNTDILLKKDEIGIDIDEVTVKLDEINEKSLLIILNNVILNDLKRMQKLPCAVLVDSDVEIDLNIPTFFTKNIRRSTAYIFSNLHQINYSDTKFIGITGTNGKTTTATYIYHIFNESGEKVGFFGTGNINLNGTRLSDEYYSMTTPDPWILYPRIKDMQNSGCKIIVMEVSSHSLFFEKTSPIEFEYAVFTNLSEEHLDFHSSMEEYFNVKKKLFQSCKNAILNIDDEYARVINREISCRKINIGILWKGDVFATHISDLGLLGSEYMYRSKDLIFKMKLHTPGVYNIYNSMLATAVCCDLGVKPCIAKQSLNNLDKIDGRFEIYRSDITVVSDYAHTTAAFETLLKTIFGYKENRKITVVFGCGGERDRKKRPLMAKTAEKYADNIVVTEDNSRSEPISTIINDITSGFTKNNYRIILNREYAIKECIQNAECGEIIVITGKSSEKYIIKGHEFLPFDEKAIISNSLKCRSDFYENIT